jgi:DNA-binding transcriptional LysR family regulator
MSGSVLSLNHLRYFRDAVLLGGVGPAAKRNRVTSSAISQAIKSLETHFSIEILEHAKNQFVLTGNGKVLFEHCHSIFAAADALEDEVRASQTGLKGEVTFGTQRSIAQTILPRFVAAMNSEYPQIKLKIFLGTTNEVANWISNRTVDIGFAVDNFGDHNFIAKPLVDGRFVLVESHTSGRRLDKHRGYILPGAITRESQTFKKNYRAAFAKEPNVLLEVPSWGVVKELSEAGMGIGLVPDYLLRFAPKGSIREVKLDLPSIDYSISAYYCRRRQRLPKVSQFFLDTIVSFAKKL